MMQLHPDPWCNMCFFLWSLLVGQGYPQHTPPKFEMEPDNDGFPKESLFLGAGFQVPCSTPLELQRLEWWHIYIRWYGSAMKGSLYRRVLGLKHMVFFCLTIQNWWFTNIFYLHLHAVFVWLAPCFVAFPWRNETLPFWNEENSSAKVRLRGRAKFWGFNPQLWGAKHVDSVNGGLV